MTMERTQLQIILETTKVLFTFVSDIAEQDNLLPTPTC